VESSEIIGKMDEFIIPGITATTDEIIIAIPNIPVVADDLIMETIIY
jgi:hypothetical protein